MDASASLSEGLVAVYRKLEADGKAKPGDKEGATFFLAAEAALNETENNEEGLKKAEAALAKFRETGNKSAVVDSLRMVIHAYKAKVESLRWSEIGNPVKNLVGQTIRSTEKLAKEEMEKFRAASDSLGEGGMLLSLAELNHDKRGPAKREDALEAATQAQTIFSDVKEKRLEASAWFILSAIFFKKHDVQEALRTCNEALSIFQELNDRSGQARTLHMMAAVQHQDDAFAEAMKSANNALELFREMGNKKLVAFECYSMAQWFLMSDKFKQALPLARESLAIFQEISYDKGWLQGAADLVVQAQLVKGDKKQAMQLALDGLKTCQEKGDKRGEVFARGTLVSAHLGKDNHEDALQVAEDALAVCRDLDDKRWESNMLHTVSQVHMAQKSYDQASTAVQESQAIFQELGDKKEEAHVLGTLTTLHFAKKDYKMAMQVASEQRDLYQSAGEKVGEAYALLSVANAYGMDEKLDDAMSTATEAQTIFQEENNKRGEGCAWNMIAEVHLVNEMHELAMQAAQKMQSFFQEIGDKKLQATGFKMQSNIHLGKEEHDEAVKLANQAHACAKASEDKKTEVEMLLLVSNANLSGVVKSLSDDSGQDGGKVRKALDKAMKPAKEAVSASKKMGNKSFVASAVYTVGTVQQVSGRFDEAIKSSVEAAKLFIEVEDPEGEVAAVTLTAEVHYMNQKPDLAKEAAEKAMTLAQACNDKYGEWRAYQVIEKMKAPVQQVQQQQQQLAPQAGAAPVASAAVVEEKKGLDIAVVTKMVQETLKASIGTDDGVDMDTPLMEAGMDSLSMVAFRNQLQRDSGISMPASVMFDYPTMSGLVDHLVETSKN